MRPACLSSNDGRDGGPTNTAISNPLSSPQIEEYLARFMNWTATEGAITVSRSFEVVTRIIISTIGLWLRNTIVHYSELLHTLSHPPEISIKG